MSTWCLQLVDNANSFRPQMIALFQCGLNVSQFEIDRNLHSNREQKDQNFGLSEPKPKPKIKAYRYRNQNRVHLPIVWKALECDVIVKSMDKICFSLIFD